MKKNKNIIVFIVIFISIFYKYLSFYEIENESVTMAIIFIAIILNIVIIIKKKFSKKQLITVLIPFIFVTVMARSLDSFVTLLIALMFSKNDIREFFKIFFISSLTCYLLTITLNFAGVLEDNSIRRFTENGVIVRNSLGFSHVNGVFKNFLPIVLSGYFLVKEKNIRKYNLFIFIISTVLYSISNSRTGYLCIVIYLLFTTFIDIMKFKTIRNSVKYIFIICTIITLVIANFAGKSENNSINELLSNRPVIWNYFINNANAISFINVNFTRIPIDNTYITYLVNYGVLAYIIMFLIKYFAIKKINDNRILLIILILSIYGIFENSVSYGIDFTIIIQLIYLLDNECKNLKECEDDKIENKYMNLDSLVIRK